MISRAADWRRSVGRSSGALDGVSTCTLEEERAPICKVSLCDGASRRSELARLICAVGELEFEDDCWAPAFDESGGWRAGYAAIGEKLGLPGTYVFILFGTKRWKLDETKLW